MRARTLSSPAIRKFISCRLYVELDKASDLLAYPKNQCVVKNLRAVVTPRRGVREPAAIEIFERRDPVLDSGMVIGPALAFEDGLDTGQDHLNEGISGRVG
jgi:hypothetical protein